MSAPQQVVWRRLSSNYHQPLKFVMEASPVLLLLLYTGCSSKRVDSATAHCQKYGASRLSLIEVPEPRTGLNSQCAILNTPVAHRKAGPIRRLFSLGYFGLETYGLVAKAESYRRETSKPFFRRVVGSPRSPSRAHADEHNSVLGGH